MRVEYLTVKGKRQRNEDYILSEDIDKDTSIHLIADGMGGYEFGEMAAKSVANSIYTFVSNNIHKSSSIELIKSAVSIANHYIAKLNQKKGLSMGCTLGGVLIFHSTAYLFWVGDVKIAHYHSDKLIFESKDHSLLNQLKENGSIPNSIYLGSIRHIVTKGIQGNEDGFEPEIHTTEISQDDRFVICSDGMLERNNIEFLSNIDITNEFVLNEVKKELEYNHDNSSLVVIEF